MTTWIGAIVLALAQAGQAPVPAPAKPPPTDRATIDAQLRLALVGDWLPRLDAAELRSQIGLELTATPSDVLTLHVDGAAHGLIAMRDGDVATARAEVRDAWGELHLSRLDVRAGYGRLVWGRLDEIAPTDVINPIDAARFLLEGRGDARLPVGFARARFAAGDALTIEGIVVPSFERGLFDRLDESTSPFNLVRDQTVPPGFTIDLERQQREPGTSWRNVSGGGRMQVTAGRLDVAVSAFRGFDGLGPILVELGPDSATGRLVEYHPRFTMIGADFERVFGQWAWRGETAVFVERAFATPSRQGLVAGRSFDGGVGFDRRAGPFRVFGSAILHREWSDEDPLVEKTDVNVVASIDRTFDRERYLARAFVVGNPGDGSAFVRGVFSVRARDRVAIDISAGAFLGTSTDTVGRFKGRDFLLTRMRTWF